MLVESLAHTALDPDPTQISMIDYLSSVYMYSAECSLPHVQQVVLGKDSLHHTIMPTRTRIYLSLCHPTSSPIVDTAETASFANPPMVPPLGMHLLHAGSVSST